MIEFQKQYLQIIKEQKQKSLIMQNVFGDYLQPFNDIASFVDGDFVGDTPDATAANMDNAINNVTGSLSYMKPMTDYVKEKGKSLTRAFVAPIQMCKNGGDVSAKAQQNGQNAGKFAQRQSYKAVEEECKKKNIRIKGVTSESIIAESAPFIKKCAKEHSREVSNYLRHCILEDAKQGITPNMWFNPNANPADQRDIIFENTTISFKTNNGKLICEEIQNKSKKRHLISEAVVKQATRLPNIFNINTWLSNVNEAENGNELFRVKEYFDQNPEKAELFNKIVMGKTDEFSNKQAAQLFNEIKSKGIAPEHLVERSQKALNLSQGKAFKPGDFNDAGNQIHTLGKTDRDSLEYTVDDIKNLNNNTENAAKASSTLAATSKKSDISGTQQDFPEGSTLRRTKNREYELVDKDGNRIKKIPAKELTDAQKEAAKQAQNAQIKPAETVQTATVPDVQKGLPSGQASKIPFADKGKFSQQKGIWAKIKWILKSIYQLIYKVVGFICQIILGLILFLIGLLPGVKQWIEKNGGAWAFAKKLLQDNLVGRGVIHTFSIASILLAVYGIGTAIASLLTDDQKEVLEKHITADLSLISDFEV